ncbi:DUF805 domain-containing protein [Hyphomonas sp.]|uniref:DUF805 domain-containing protein n=1 Tax=Hyphomonas sp. TaxID=87 RepID=UPI00391A03A6
MDTSTTAIDPERPWIRDVRDNPSDMNWAQTLFNPFGRTSKLHFTRAWTAMFMGRVLLYLVPSLIVGIAGMAGVRTAGLNEPVSLLLFSVPMLLAPFAVYVIVTEYTSFCAHVRRLTDAGRPVWLAIIVILPMLLGLLAYAAGTQMGAAGFRAAQEKAAAARQAPPPKPETEEETEEEAGEAAAAPAASSKGGGNGGRGGPPRPMPKSEREAAMGAGMGFAMPVWGLASFIAMLWTLLYVSRLPNEGVGRIRTGSDLTPEEAAQGL